MNSHSYCGPIHGNTLREWRMTHSSSERTTYRVQVLERAINVLQTLADDPRELAAAEIAGRLSLHKSTIHRLLMVLDRHGLIRRSEAGRYALGLRLFELGNRAVKGVRLREQAQPYLERLTRETGETAHVCVLDKGDMLSIAHAEGLRSVRMPATVGRRTPAYCSAVGKAMLAYLPQAAVDDVLAARPLSALTDKTIVTRAALLADLHQVRMRGYAIDNEEIEKGLRCVGAPVRNYSGHVVAAISVAGPAFRITRSRVPVVAHAVLAATSKLSAELGYRRREHGDARSQIAR